MAEYEDSIAKKRKLRKGTTSCWECKRRKVSCKFERDVDDCVACKRRGTKCVSQEVPEEEVPVKRGRIGDRMAKVEQFIQGLQKSPQPTQSPPAPPSPQPLSLPPPTQQTQHPTPSLFSSFPLQDFPVLISSRPPRYTHAINFHPHSKLPTLPIPITTPPSPSTHPVTLAHTMLLFALTLQAPSISSTPLSQPRHLLRHSLFTAAASYIASNEQFHNCIDVLVCIMLEATYEINCGNLRRAWVVYRRAMVVAQFMGLRRSPMPPLQRIDPSLDVDPAFMYFRIIYMDRYLSLILGLPQGTSDKNIGSPATLLHEPPQGKFDRLLTLLASQVLDRNQIEFTGEDAEMKATYNVDSELLKLSKSMPSDFWRPVDFHTLTPGTPATLLETIRLSSQVYYYGLLIQLHLPYMMHGICRQRANEYSKVTCVNASREIMSRFIAHRTFNPTSNCSRPVDFWALLAAMTLIVAHIDAHRHSGQDILAHQRVSDRAMLELALEKMDRVYRENTDAVSKDAAQLIRRLLRLESNAASGNQHSINPEDESDGTDIELQIPFIGLVVISQQGPIYRRQTTESPSFIQAYDTETTLSNRYESATDDWALQGVDTVFFDCLLRGAP